MKILGLKKVRALFKKRGLEAAKINQVSVSVGFTQNYALLVHEDKTSAHSGKGQAKYLEEPARTKRREIAKVIKNRMKKISRVTPKSFEYAMILGGLRLQRAAQKLTPVDTGALKGSAFTSLTRDEEEAASAAYTKGEAIRARGTSRYTGRRRKKK